MATPSQFLKLRGEGQPARAQDNISATLTPIANALGATPIMGANPPPWIAMDLLGGVVATTAQRVPTYHRDALGYVWAGGSFTAPGGGLLATAVVWTFPMGYRPESAIHFVAQSVGALQFLTVAPNGDVSVDQAVLGAGVTQFYFSFLAEQ